MKSILLVDDDIELCNLLTEFLQGEGFEVACVHDGIEAADRAKRESFDLFILDVMLPGKNGFVLLQEFTQAKTTPVLMLTAKGDATDRILGLDMGADDYLAKPCDPRELVARINSIFRRIERLSSGNKSLNNQNIKILDLELDVARHQITVKDIPIELTATEFQIAHLLLSNAGELVKRETISEDCLGRRLMTHDRSIDMHISHLRKKLGDDDSGNARIKTLRGVGYQYVAI